jgi:predicted Zn-dependent protease
MVMGPRLRRGLWVGVALGVISAAASLVVWVWLVSDPDRWFRRARADLLAGHPGRASAALERLERLRAPTPFDRLLRAEVDEALRRPDDALAELAAIGDAHPLAPVARLLSGQIEMKRGRLRPAEAAFLAAAALEPNSVKPHRELVYLYNLQHRQADLDAQLHALSELGTLEYGYLVHWTKTRNVVWNPARDCEDLARFLEADPGDRRSRLALAEGLRQMNRLDEAAGVLAPLPDSDSEARVLRAMLALDRGDLEALDRLLAASPDDDPNLARVRGQLALKRGDASAAVRYFRLAHAADPSDRVALFGLGSALARSADPAAAEPYLAAARRHDAVTPLITRASTDLGAKDPELPARLGAACEAAGRLYEARAWYKMAIARDPLDRGSQQAVFRLGREIAERAADRAVTGPPPRNSAVPQGPKG